MGATTVRSLHGRCSDLFTRYPMAVDGGRSMVLMTEDGGDPEFFVLARLKGDVFLLWEWAGAEDRDVEITPDGCAPPDARTDAITRGVPLPRDGMLFGWLYEDIITALVAVYARCTPETPEPSWSVLPLAGVPEGQWPPFAGERLIGGWFWEHCEAGRLIDLGPFVAGTRGEVFWVPAEVAPGSGHCCAVARDVRSGEGWTLPAGRFVYYRPLRAGVAVPPLEEMLADAGKTDLAPRFQGDEAVR